VEIKAARFLLKALLVLILTLWHKACNLYSKPNNLKPTIMKSNIYTIATILSLLFVYTAQAEPGKTIFYKSVITASNNVTYVNKSMANMPVKSGWVKKEVAISWETLTEVNTSHFELQRSSNNKDFETIATIAANCNSKKSCTYSFVDSNNENRRGQSYYRLKAVFANGEEMITDGVKTKKTGVFDMNQSYAAAAGMSN
jgi:hypothetical protein